MFNNIYENYDVRENQTNILKEEDKIGVIIFINNFAEIDEYDIKRNFIDKLKDNIKCFYFENLGEFSQFEKELDEITKRFSETNILVFHYSYGNKSFSKDFNLYYLKGNKTFIKMDCFYNILAKNKSEKSTIVVFSNIIEKNSHLNTFKYYPHENYPYLTDNKETRHKIIRQDRKWKDILHFQIDIKEECGFCDIYKNHPKKYSASSFFLDNPSSSLLLHNIIFKIGLFSERQDFFSSCKNILNEMESHFDDNINEHHHIRYYYHYNGYGYNNVIIPKIFKSEIRQPPTKIQNNYLRSYPSRFERIYNFPKNTEDEDNEFHFKSMLLW